MRRDAGAGGEADAEIDPDAGTEAAEAPEGGRFDRPDGSLPGDKLVLYVYREP